MDLIWIFLPFILALGIITSYEDIRFSKIRNLWIIIAIILSIIIHFILFFASIIYLSYIIRISLFVIFSFIIGFAMYLMKLWSAGDAKLFTAYVSLFPLTFYSLVTTSFWPLEIIINTILPASIFLLFVGFFKLDRDGVFSIMKKILNPKNLGVYLLTIFSISWIIKMIFDYFQIQTSFLLNVIGIMMIMYFLKKVFDYELVYILIFIAVLRIFINKEYIMRQIFWKSFLFMTLAYAIIIFFIGELVGLYIKKANINFIKEGMHPVEIIVKHKGHYFKVDKLHPDLEPVYEQKPEGLTKEDIDNIKKLHRTGHLHFNYINVQQTLPFAPYMFAGVLLSLLVKGNVVLWVVALF